MAIKVDHWATLSDIFEKEGIDMKWMINDNKKNVISVCFESPIHGEGIGKILEIYGYKIIEIDYNDAIVKLIYSPSQK